MQVIFCCVHRHESLLNCVNHPCCVNLLNFSLSFRVMNWSSCFLLNRPCCGLILQTGF
ncbi:MAG: hypothetical protein Q4D12_10980 [Bacteroidales bacterium]|nr:hypothetical protein [Bacteroidales bacterium]